MKETALQNHSIQSVLVSLPRLFPEEGLSLCEELIHRPDRFFRVHDDRWQKGLIPGINIESGSWETQSSLWKHSVDVAVTMHEMFRAINIQEYFGSGELFESEEKQKAYLAALAYVSGFNHDFGKATDDRDGYRRVDCWEPERRSGHTFSHSVRGAVTLKEIKRKFYGSRSRRFVRELTLLVLYHHFPERLKSQGLRVFALMLNSADYFLARTEKRHQGRDVLSLEQALAFTAEHLNQSRFDTFDPELKERILSVLSEVARCTSNDREPSCCSNRGLAYSAAAGL